MFIRGIIWILLFILAYRAVKYIIRIMSGSNEDNSKVNKGKNSGKININKDDIIEADFEEIKDSKKDNSN